MWGQPPSAVRERSEPQGLKPRNCCALTRPLRLRSGQALKGHSSTYTGRVNGQTKAREVRAKEVLRDVTTHSAEETIAFGRTLAELLTPPKLVLLRGDLGAGKTTLVKGIAAAFEAAAEEDVTSPTFTLVHEYRGSPSQSLSHRSLPHRYAPRIGNACPG